MNDLEAMQQALLLAASVEGRTSPRPPVGAVLVRDGIAVGQGATAPPYGPHAEVVALQAAGAAAAGATLYVTLEPCCVTIHTPPCTEAIRAASIRRVVVGTLDPNPLVAGRGIAQLQAAGIEVTVLEHPQASQLLRPFATLITQQRPYVTAKWAMTLDGKLATHTGDSYWISGPQSRAWVHALRDRVDALLIGSATALQDNPQLTVRLPVHGHVAAHARAPRAGPLRVVLATHGRLPTHLHLLEPELAAGTCVLVGETCPTERFSVLEACGVQVRTVAVDARGMIDIAAALRMLAHMGFMHVLIEGGAQVLGSAFDQHAIDHIAAFVAPKIIGGSTAPSPVGGQGGNVMSEAWQLDHPSSQQFGDDIFIEGEVNYIHKK